MSLRTLVINGLKNSWFFAIQTSLVLALVFSPDSLHVIHPGAVPATEPSADVASEPWTRAINQNKPPFCITKASSLWYCYCTENG